MPLTSCRMGMVRFLLGSRRNYLDGVDDGVEDGGQAAAADAHVGLGVEVLEAHLDGGHVDADPVDAVLELEQESLVVLVGDADEALQQGPALLRAEALHVDVDDLPLPAAAVERDDGAADAVVGGQFLERRPPQRLLVVLLPGGAREDVLPAPPHGAAVPPPHARHLLDVPHRLHYLSPPPCSPAA
ncbi:hypothetical protein U9M48_018501, partial [Paspalum notatum var. saurae]